MFFKINKHEQFSIAGDKVFFIDPAYKRKCNKGVLVSNVLPGEWKIRTHGYRETVVDKIKMEISSYKRKTHLEYHGAILIHQSDSSREDLLSATLKDTHQFISVDSAHIAILDEKTYPLDGTCFSDDERIDMCSLSNSHPEEIYSDDFMQLLEVHQQVDFGSYNNACAIVSSGYGDGAYPVLTLIKNEKVIGIIVVFIFKKTDYANKMARWYLNNINFNTELKSKKQENENEEDDKINVESFLDEKLEIEFKCE
jgi:hypothetical protein